MKRFAFVIGLLLAMLALAAPALAGTMLLLGAGSVTTGGATLPTVTFISTGNMPHSGSVFTVTAANLGTPDANRLVAVGMGGSIPSGRVINSVTIGGVSATVAVSSIISNSLATAIAYAVVPTGSTGDIVVTMSNSMFGDWTYSVSTIDASLLSSQTPQTASGQATSAASVVTGTLASQAGGALVAAVSFTSGSGKNPVAWLDGNLDTFTNDIASPASYGAGHANGLLGGNTTVTFTWTGVFTAILAAASWR